jgi:hypothetical protein
VNENFHEGLGVLGDEFNGNVAKPWQLLKLFREARSIFTQLGNNSITLLQLEKYLLIGASDVSIEADGYC